MQPSPAKSNHLPLPASPAESGFLPRKEFAPNKHTPHSFALLTLTGASSIRLAHFPAPFVAVLRAALDSRDVRSFREDTQQQVCEFVLGPKYWANSKTIETEKLLVDILTTLDGEGFTLLSAVDYGREPGDRLSLAFCKEAPNGNNAATPKAIWALSFPTATSLRVVNPPLNSTPAILQSVRTAWPRGVTSERKVGDGCFEFKLKGYSFFAEDTFPADSLHHILALLQSLDKHSFTLLTSVSLTPSRSRTKDLWIFQGPDPDNTSHSTPAAATQPLRSRETANGTAAPVASSLRAAPSDEPLRKPSPLGPGAGQAQSLGLHTRAATQPQGHFRNASADSTTQHPRRASAAAGAPGEIPNVLRKKQQQGSPRTQVAPLPAVDSASSRSKPSPPSSSSSTPAPPKQAPAAAPAAFQPPAIIYSTAPSTVTAVATPPPPPPPALPPYEPPAPALARTSVTPPIQGLQVPETHRTNSDESSISPALLGDNAFRDSSRDTTSSDGFRDSAFSHDIPVMWTGSKIPNTKPILERGDSSQVLPGAWRDSTAMKTPTIEKAPFPENGLGVVEGHVNARVDGVEIEEGGMELRRSEFGILGTTSPGTRPTSSQPPPPLPPLPAIDTNVPNGPQKDGWVLVNTSPPLQTNRDSRRSSTTAAPAQHDMFADSPEGQSDKNDSPPAHKKASGDSSTAVASPTSPLAKFPAKSAVSPTSKAGGSLRRFFSRKKSFETAQGADKVKGRGANLKKRAVKKGDSVASSNNSSEAVNEDGTKGTIGSAKGTASGRWRRKVTT